MLVIGGPDFVQVSYIQDTQAVTVGIMMMQKGSSPGIEKIAAPGRMSEKI